MKRFVVMVLLAISLVTVVATVAHAENGGIIRPMATSRLFR